MRLFIVVFGVDDKIAREHKILARGTKQVISGCDDVHYWNATVAASHGMAVSKAGMCAPQLTCGGLGSLQCPMAKHYCDYQVPDQGWCGIMDPGGTCWGLPQKCPSVMIGPQFRKCSSGPSEPCISECEGIKAEHPYYFDQTCPV